MLLQYFCPFFQNYSKGQQFYYITIGSSHILQCLKKMNTQTHNIRTNIIRKNFSRLDEPHRMLHQSKALTMETVFLVSMEQCRNTCLNIMHCTYVICHWESGQYLIIRFHHLKGQVSRGQFNNTVTGRTRHVHFEWFPISSLYQLCMKCFTNFQINHRIKDLPTGCLRYFTKSHLLPNCILE